ncbi:unnamed protein product, partial [Didymodactylos carnosus]
YLLPALTITQAIKKSTNYPTAIKPLGRSQSESSFLFTSSGPTSSTNSTNSIPLSATTGSTQSTISILPFQSYSNQASSNHSALRLSNTSSLTRKSLSILNPSERILGKCGEIL